MIKLLFLCTGNSCRSQMAEGWARHLKGDVIEAYSAGIATHGLNPRAVKVMAEAGVDISGHRSKCVDELKDVPFDYVVTVCGHAHETCPMWLGGKARVVHVGFDDPPKLAQGAGTEEEALDHFRRVRDEIRAFVAGLPEGLERRAQCAQHFDVAAATWDEKPGRRELIEAIAAGMVKQVPLQPDWRVLDYGCGTGMLSALLAGKVGHIVAADTSAGMLQELRGKIEAAGLRNVEPRLLDLTTQAPPVERFDLIVCSMALHHVEDVGRLLAAFAALAAPGGWLAIADLAAEDGSFHTDVVVPHHGFDPAQLATEAQGQGWGQGRSVTVHRLVRAGREYPVFLLTARQSESV